jgi:hypothetical protein
MGKIHPQIDEDLAAFLRRQHVFFVATAPLSAEGNVNLSPKGFGSFAILDPHTVAYLDLTGSGIETVAHLRENGRIVLLFCAFEGAPKIVRLHGRGEAVQPGDADFEGLQRLFPPQPGVRSVVRMRLTRIADSCGYGVPLYDYVGQRDQLQQWAERKGDDGLRTYREQKNARSIDGLPGLRNT